MKRYFLKTATWFFLLLFFVGCKGTPQAPTLEHALDCQITLVKNGIEYQGELQSPILERYQFGLTSPPSVKGMNVTIENGKVTYRFQEITHSKEQGHPFSLLEEACGIWEQAVRGEGLVWEQSVERWIGKGMFGETPFTIVCDKKTNHPVSITTQDGLTVEFSFE